MNDNELMALYGDVVSDAKSETEVLGHFTGAMTNITPYVDGKPVPLLFKEEMEAERLGLWVEQKRKDDKGNALPPLLGLVFVDAGEFTAKSEKDGGWSLGDVIIVDFDYCESENRTSKKTNREYVRVDKARDITYRKIGHVALKSNQRDASGNVVMKDGKAVRVDGGRGEIKYPKFVKPAPMTVAGLLGGRKLR